VIVLLQIYDDTNAKKFVLNAIERARTDALALSILICKLVFDANSCTCLVSNGVLTPEDILEREAICGKVASEIRELACIPQELQASHFYIKIYVGSIYEHD